MRVRSSFKQESNRGMELNKLSRNLEEEPPFSGAYMRSLVKQLRTNDQGCVVNGDASSHGQNLTKHGKIGKACQSQQSTQQPQQHKKQVRRRLHTSRPYQERLLNMAEARREIVTALKFHRASMKEASEQQQQQQLQQQQQQRAPDSPQLSQNPSFDQDGRYKSRRNPRIYPSCNTNFSSYMGDFSSYPPAFVPNSYPVPVASPIAPPPLMAENPNFILPNQPLGLNLNFHDFNNLDATIHLSNTSLSSNSFSSATSSSQEVPSVELSQGDGISSLVNSTESNAASQVNAGLHAAMDEEAIAEIRSLGEQYQMEWNDTMNLVKSACWFKFLRNMEHGAPEANTEGDAYHNFDQPLEFPAWLNANESCLDQCSVEYFQNSTLPW